MNDFYTWCYHAVAEIRYKPDREAVFQELMAHLEDHYDALIREGHSPEKAQRLALEAMGSPEVIAPQLGKIHKPFLGYLYRVTKFLAIAACAWALFLLVAFAGSYIHDLISTANYNSLQSEGEGGLYIQPNVSDSSDGYRFTITEAAINAEADTLYIELQTTYWFWMKEPAIAGHFWAVDSNGNYYASRIDAQYADIPKVVYGGGFYSQGFCSQDLEITHFDGTAEWLELHYNRDGRDIVLRIDLTGGEGA